MMVGRELPDELRAWATLVETPPAIVAAFDKSDAMTGRNAAAHDRVALCRRSPRKRG